MAHCINAKVVHRWRQLAREGAQATANNLRGLVPAMSRSLLNHGRVTAPLM